MNIIDELLIEEVLTKLLQEGKITAAEDFSITCIGGLRGKFKISNGLNEDEEEICDRIDNGDFDDEVRDRAYDLDFYEEDEIENKIICGDFDETVEERAIDLGYTKDGE